MLLWCSLLRGLFRYSTLFEHTKYLLVHSVHHLLSLCLSVSIQRANDSTSSPWVCASFAAPSSGRWLIDSTEKKTNTRRRIPTPEFRTTKPASFSQASTAGTALQTRTRLLVIKISPAPPTCKCLASSPHSTQCPVPPPPPTCGQESSWL